MAMMIKIIVSLVLLVVVLALVGFVLPKQFKIERSTVIAAPAEKIYPLIAEPKNWPKWGVWNQRDPQMKVTFSGATSGVGAKWSWESKSEGNGAMEFNTAEPNKQIGYILTFVDMGMESKGVLSLSAEGANTRIRWTNEGEFGGNPFVRYFGLIMDRMVGKDFEAGLNNLKALAEKP
jgi:uncharacterized protein YndB with AHSA1/START domain